MAIAGIDGANMMEFKLIKNNREEAIMVGAKMPRIIYQNIQRHAGLFFRASN